MPKYQIEDMVKRKRSIQDIQKESKRNIVRKIEKSSNENIEFQTDPVQNNSRYMIWIVAFISVVFCFFAISFLFEKAEIIINPKINDVTLKENLSAFKDASSDDLSFDLAVIEGTEETIIKATGEEDLKNSASGTVIIYNAFSTSTQTFAVDTRLEGSNGKIYKIQSKIIVPGMSKAGIPGSIEANIYGSVPGPEYNSAPLDFKILGFKGTPKYAKFYGRSKGEITGGFIGKTPIISDSDKTTALKSLKNILQVKLSKKVADQIPAGFILFENATFFDVQEDSSNVSSRGNDVPIKIKGTLYAILFNEQKLTRKLIKDDSSVDGVYISNIKDLKFTLDNKDNTTFKDLINLSFNLSGPARIVSRVDVDKIAADLFGKAKKDFNLILSQYTNINSASLTITPPWKRSIPEKTQKIKVIVNYP